MKKIIKAKDRETVIQSLKSGVVPRVGLQHIQVGRSEEHKSFISYDNAIAEYERLLAWGIPEDEALQSVLENFEV